MLRLISVLFAISIICFVLMAFSPLDPLLQYLGGESAVVSGEKAQKIAAQLGLDQPYHIQYIRWIKKLFCGDFGYSTIYECSVISIIKEKAGASMLLLFVSWLITGILGFAFGVIAAVKEGKIADRVLKVYALAMASAPPYWVGLLLVMFFSIYLGWFPVGLSSSINAARTQASLGDVISHLFLPALTLSLSGIAQMTLHVRQKLLDIFSTDYILFAKARGEKTMMLFKNHGFRNVLLPAVTIQFASLGEIFGGSTLVEKVFSYPGLGSAIVTAGIKGDIPLLLGISLISSVFIFAGNFIADVLCYFIDPRISRGGIYEL
ncbi:MAG: ABC transporter permease [Treponema sp.]|nr:ABC transporter permease [Treponema sp.]